MAKVDVHICEVGPRDGLQNAHHLMPTAVKKVWISALAAAGFEEIEVGSFVPPKLIPAMADTGEIVAHARTITNPSCSAFRACSRRRRRFPASRSWLWRRT